VTGAPEPVVAVAGLLDVLDLRPEAADGDVFTGGNQPVPWGRVYGGQVLGQTVVAAQRTVESDRVVHSMHAYFLRPGDPSAPIRFEVERLRDGGSFSARRVQALQEDRPILSMIASFQVPGNGFEHADPMPDVPPPESLPSLDERLAHLPVPAERAWWLDWPIELRHVEPPVFLEPAAQRSTREHLWLRTRTPLPGDGIGPLHAAVLAFASDFGMVEPILRGHGVSLAASGLRVASLDHAMWWHRPARVDDWLLLALDSPAAAGARGLGRASVFDRGGLLVASIAQECLVRPARGGPR
jgi:acyl-CoA thioesterase II